MAYYITSAGLEIDYVVFKGRVTLISFPKELMFVSNIETRQRNI